MNQNRNEIQGSNIINDKIMQLQLNLDSIYEDYNQYCAVKKDLILESFDYHLKNNIDYANYSKRLGIGADFDKKNFQVENIPLLPSALFKRGDLNLLSTDESSIIKYCQSSGTSGSLSIIPRDETTLSNLLGSISSLFPAFLGIERAGTQKGFVLGPTTEESGDLWFSYVISCVSLIMQAECMEKDGVIDLDDTCSKIKSALLNGDDVTIIGPPFKILELSEKIAEQSDWPGLTPKSYIISAGGWKNRFRESINDVEYMKLVSERFKVKSDSSIRDMFNMVELNTVLPECECHKKHIPPWVDVIIRDASTNQRVKNGQKGIISFLDASSFSYPNFILSEDIGVVTENDCPCGRKGQTLTILRRMNNIESRGCALKMAIGSEIKSEESGRLYQSYFRNPEKYR